MAQERGQSRGNGQGRSGGPRGRSGGPGGAGGRSRSGGASRGPGKPSGRSYSGDKAYGENGGRSRSEGRPGARTGGSRPPRNDNRSARTDRRPTDKAQRTADEIAYDGPELPAEISGKELDPAVRSQLKGLPEKLAARIARHLVAAGLYVDEDPELAYRHAKAARARAGRLAVVREALGEAAYAAGHYAEALAELRAAKRMNGATAYLPIMADCHRALGHPEQAIKLAKSPSVANFSSEAKAEMTLVEAGARRDMGQFDAALRTLELAPLNAKSREPWVVRLRYGYADILEAAGRDQDALTWFHRTHAIDGEELTDADVRAEALERKLR